MKIDNKGHESDLEDEIIEMHVDLEAKALLKGKKIAEYWRISILLLCTQCSEHQQNHTYLHSQLHT